jgi:hypothetical protein
MNLSSAISQLLNYFFDFFFLTGARVSYLWSESSTPVAHQNAEATPSVTGGVVGVEVEGGVGGGGGGLNGGGRE